MRDLTSTDFGTCGVGGGSPGANLPQISRENHSQGQFGTLKLKVRAMKEEITDGIWRHGNHAIYYLIDTCMCLLILTRCFGVFDRIMQGF